MDLDDMPEKVLNFVFSFLIKITTTHRRYK
jgi:hypothetical protein